MSIPEELSRRLKAMTREAARQADEYEEKLAALTDELRVAREGHAGQRRNTLGFKNDLEKAQARIAELERENEMLRVEVGRHAALTDDVCMEEALHCKTAGRLRARIAALEVEKNEIERLLRATCRLIVDGVDGEGLREMRSTQSSCLEDIALAITTAWGHVQTEMAIKDKRIAELEHLRKMWHESADKMEAAIRKDVEYATSACRDDAHCDSAKRLGTTCSDCPLQYVEYVSVFAEGE